MSNQKQLQKAWQDFSKKISNLKAKQFLVFKKVFKHSSDKQASNIRDIINKM
jgi:hypothetical protein